MRPILILMCVLLFAVPLFAQSPIPDNITADLQKLATDIGQEQSDAANLTAANAALTAAQTAAASAATAVTTDAATVQADDNQTVADLNAWIASVGPANVPQEFLKAIKSKAARHDLSKAIKYSETQVTVTAGVCGSCAGGICSTCPCAPATPAVAKKTTTVTKTKTVVSEPADAGPVHRACHPRTDEHPALDRLFPNRHHRRHLFR